MSCYEEFALLPEQARELGLPPDRVPVVRREAVEVAPGRRLSALVWGDGPGAWAPKIRRQFGIDHLADAGSV